MMYLQLDYYFQRERSKIRCNQGPWMGCPNADAASAIRPTLYSAIMVGNLSSVGT